MTLSKQFLFTKLLLLSLLIFHSSAFANKEEKPEVLLMMSSHASKPKGELLKLMAQDQPFVLTVFSTKGKSEEEIKASWNKAGLILLDGINPALSKFMFAKYQDYLIEMPHVPVISLGDINNQKMNKGLSSITSETVGKYYKNAGRDNYKNMMKYISKSILNFSNVSNDNSITQPVIVPNVGLYHPDFIGQVTADETAFF